MLNLNDFEDGEHENLQFQPFVFEEQILEREQIRLDDERNQPIQIAIDDYFDPSKNLKIRSKQSKKMENVFDQITALKKAASREKRKGSKSRNSSKNKIGTQSINRKKKKPKHQSTDRHMQGGWNTDIRTEGVFDRHLTKEELAEKKRIKRHPKTKIKVPQLSKYVSLYTIALFSYKIMLF